MAVVQEGQQLLDGFLAVASHLEQGLDRKYLSGPFCSRRRTASLKSSCWLSPDSGVSGLVLGVDPRLRRQSPSGTSSGLLS